MRMRNTASLFPSLKLKEITSNPTKNVIAENGVGGLENNMSHTSEIPLRPNDALTIRNYTTNFQ